jgi:hypothetical protein
MAVVVNKPLCCFLGLPPSTVRPPPTVTLFHTDGRTTVFHFFASNRFLIVGQSSPDASILQMGLKLPQAHFRNHATSYPFLVIQPIRDNLLLELAFFIATALPFLP